MSNAAKQIDALLGQAHDIAYAEIERMARDIMRKHKRCASFCMCMGTASFYEADGNPISEWSGMPKYLNRFYELVSEWADYTRVTGSPMRIDGADAPLRKDW